MADDEWLRFQAELAAVEQQVGSEEAQQVDPGAATAVAPAATWPPPVAPAPTRTPPAAVMHALPVVSKPPVTAVAPQQGPQFSAPPAASLAPSSAPGPMASHGLQQQGIYAGQPGMMQTGMGMGMGIGGIPMGMGMAMEMGMGMLGMGMGMLQHQQQQQQQQPTAVAAAAAAAAAAKPGGSKPQQGGKKKVLLRQAGGQKWVDPSLNEWPDNDFRIFVGDLGNEVTDDLLAKSFSKYSSFAKAKIVRDPRTKKSKGYGFVSFLDGNDFAKALREMQGKYIGNRPCKLSKSNWDERTVRKVTVREPQGGNSNKKQKR